MYFRSKIRLTKPKNESIKSNSNFKIDDLFGTVSFSKDYPTKYPNTVPLAKPNGIRNGGLNHLFDKNDDMMGTMVNHSTSATVTSRRKQPQQIFVSNQK